MSSVSHASSSSHAEAVSTSPQSPVAPWFSEPGLHAWHGSQSWSFPPSLRPSRAKRYECGPGLYASTHLHTASKYAKGSGSVVALTLDPDTRWLTWSHTVSLKEMETWLTQQDRFPRRKAVIADIHRHLERDHAQGFTPDTRVPLEVLINLCIYHDALTGKHGPALAAWLVEHGVDASRQRQSGEEEWWVIFNPAVVRRGVKVSRTEIQYGSADCRPLQEQQARCAAAHQDTVHEEDASVPRRRTFR